MMEPLIMAILGVLVGGLVIAMYLPISKWVLWSNATITFYFIENPTTVAVGLLSLCIGSFLNVVIFVQK